MINSPTLRDEMSVFYKEDASQEEITVAGKEEITVVGQHFFLAWYGVETFGSLNTVRFLQSSF